MKSETTIARRFIRDHMIAHGLTPQSICIDSPLIKSVKSAGVKYKCYQEQRKEKQKYEATIKQEAISSDMLKLKAKCDQMQRAIDIMEKEFVDCTEKTEARNDMSLVIKGNGLKRKSEQTKGDLKLLQDEYGKLDEKRKKLLFLSSSFTLPNY